VSKRRIQVLILTEDKQQRTFVERFLKGISFKHKLRSLPLSAGKGSGEQNVREHYAEQVQELRRCSGHLQRALVVVVDADTGEVADRQRQLKSANLEPRGASERVIHLIPRRNVETWIECLLGKKVDEKQEYPKRLKGRESECQPAVNRLIELYRTNLQPPPECPSLATALEELRRLT
jgi:hypothetical protein